MTRTTWLQARRMEKSCDVLERFNAKRLSAHDASELPAMCERSFCRYLRRHEADGLDRLFDHRLGAAGAGGPSSGIRASHSGRRRRNTVCRRRANRPMSRG